MTGELVHFPGTEARGDVARRGRGLTPSGNHDDAASESPQERKDADREALVGAIEVLGREDVSIRPSHIGLITRAVLPLSQRVALESQTDEYWADIGRGEAYTAASTAKAIGWSLWHNSPQEVRRSLEEAVLFPHE